MSSLKPVRVQFVLISEGTSDHGLVSHLESVCIHLGADEVLGSAIDAQRLSSAIGIKVTDKIKVAVALEPHANLFLIHRDADSPDARPRYEEIQRAVLECDLQAAWAAVIPVQETEAWLLLDEEAIRRVASRPSGRLPLGLPGPKAVESLANPKEHLKRALATAGEVSGRRLEKLKQDFPRQRQNLLQSLSLDGKHTTVSSWQKMVADMKTAIELIARDTQRN